MVVETNWKNRLPNRVVKICLFKQIDLQEAMLAANTFVCKGIQ